MNPAPEARSARYTGSEAVTLRHPPHPHQMCSGSWSALFDWPDLDPGPPKLNQVNATPWLAGSTRSTTHQIKVERCHGLGVPVVPFLRIHQCFTTPTAFCDTYTCMIRVSHEVPHTGRCACTLVCADIVLPVKAVPQQCKYRYLYVNDHPGPTATTNVLP